MHRYIILYVEQVVMTINYSVLWWCIPYFRTICFEAAPRLSHEEQVTRGSRSIPPCSESTPFLEELISLDLGKKAVEVSRAFESADYRQDHVQPHFFAI